MGNRLAGWIMLAEADPFSNMGSNFRGESAQISAYEAVSAIAFLLALIIGGLLLSRALSRQERLKRFNSPQALFRTLCDTHGLSRAERQLLLELAKEQQLADPARLFLEPERFDALGHQWNAQHTQLERVREKLFAGLPAEDGITPGATGVPPVPSDLSLQ